MMISRGYNRSGQPAGIGNYALEHLVEDVRALVQVLLKKKQLPPRLQNRKNIKTGHGHGLGAEKCFSS